MKWHHKALFLTFAVVAVGLIFGVWKDTYQQERQTPQLYSGTALPNSMTFPEFVLTNESHQPFTQELFKNQWSLVFFGYTQCPELCPKTLSLMSEVKQIVGLQSPFQMYLITINPEQDTPEQLHAFLAQPVFKKGMIKGLTGERAHIQKLAQTIGLHVQEEIPEVGHIEHSGTILVVNPQGELQALFSHPEDSFLVAKDLQRMMRFHQQNA